MKNTRESSTTSNSSTSTTSDYYISCSSSRHSIRSSISITASQQPYPPPPPPPPSSSCFTTIPLAEITPQSQRELSELTTTPSSSSSTATTAAAAGGARKERARGTRPGHGIFLFLLLLLTIAGVVLWSIPKTRKSIGLYIYLPMYSVCVVAYILFLCCVKSINGKDDDHDDDDDCNKNNGQKEERDKNGLSWLDDGTVPPLVLRDYLEKKRQERKRTTMKKTTTNKKNNRKTKIQTTRGGKKDKMTQDLELNTTSRTEEDSFQDHDPSSSEDTFSGAYDDDMTDTFQDDSTSPPPPPPCHRRHGHHHHPETLHHRKDENHLGVVFQIALPKLSQTFESLEGQIYTFAAKIRHAMVPPHTCYECKDGVQVNNNNSNMIEDVFEHNHNDDEHGYYQQDTTGTRVFQAPQTNVENYLAQVVEGEYHPTTAKRGVDLSGKYKLVHNYNFDAFLKSQNVPLLIRKAANSSRPIHTITHEGDRLRIQVDGITKGDTTYIIDGPPSGSNIRHLKFDDYVTWVDDGQAVQVRKVAKNAPPNGAVELIVKRQLANHGHNLILTSKAKFDDGSESLESVQTFHRIHH
jgi:hypothetical protein